MSKGLDELNEMCIETYKYGFDKYNENRDLFIKHIKSIEEELKAYQEYNQILNDYNLTITNFREACLLLAMLKGENLNIHNIAKQLKALKIIERKEVNVALLKTLIRYHPTDALQEYNKIMLNDYCDLYLLTKEEYDLLKEVLTENYE